MTILKSFQSSVPTVPWGNINDLSREAERKAWSTCKQRDAGHCINSNFVYAFAAFQGRAIRAVQTYKGYTVWSENFDGVWCRYRAPLKKTYAAKIDQYDLDGQNFKLPIRIPMGRVEFVEFCIPRAVSHPNETAKDNTDRDDRYGCRVKNGKVRVGARLRQPQLQYVGV